jgi:hypothetical protein
MQHRAADGPEHARRLLPERANTPVDLHIQVVEKP